MTTAQWALLILSGGALAVAAALYTVWPLIARRGTRPGRAAHELALLKAQMREIDRDLARGAISDVEAEGARREIGRRILAADASLSAEPEFAPAPTRLSQRAALLSALVVTLGGAGVYLGVGAPGAPDRPLAARDIAAEIKASQFTQAEAEARFGALAPAPAAEDPDDALRFAGIEAQVRRIIAERPDDPESRMVLAEALRERGRHRDAYPLIQEAIRLIGMQANPDLYVLLGQTMTMAAGGYVSQEAEQVFAQNTASPLSQYFIGLAALQRGERSRTLAIWMRVLAEARASGGADPGFTGQLEDQLRTLAQEMELDANRVMAAVARRAGEAPPGPSAADIEAAAQMTPEERMAMIQGMVSGLEERSRETPKALTGEDWSRLIVAHARLGDQAAARSAIARARSALAGDADALADLTRLEESLELQASPIE